MPTEFKMFEPGGLGGNFMTYVGTRTGAFFRLDLERAHYQGKTLDELLSSAVQREGSLDKVPDKITCKVCGNVFSAVSIPIDGEEVINAYEL